MIHDTLLAAILARLEAVLARPAVACRPLLVDAHAAGWLTPERAARLSRFSGVFTVRRRALEFVPALDSEHARTAALDPVVRTLAAEGLLTQWRDEVYAVAPAFRGPVSFHIERAAARFFGMVTYAAHVNGLVARDDGLCMWLARRSPHKSIDPGQLDNLVGGGIRAGTTAMETVRREAWEEAGIADSIAARAQPVGAVQLCREQPDGLQREVIFVHDLALAASYSPTGVDGEAVDHRLVTLGEAAGLIAQSEGPDVVTADASLVILDCLFRHGAIHTDSPHYLPLAALRMSSLGIGSIA
ncbi:MAG: DUF4743 domain-containing protein [Betaproteobacteria bacterium]